MIWLNFMAKDVKMNKIKIADKLIGRGEPPLIIAEMSGNHNQSLNRALMIVEAAAKAGVDAVKLQTYTADTMTINKKDGEFMITDPKSLWCGKSLYELYQEAHTPWEWHKPIFDRCKELGLICFSTPFDETAVDFLEELNVPCYKIASFENTDVNLLKKVAQTGKPIIVSTGMVSLSDLELMVKTIREVGCNDFVLLKCTSSYPASPKDSNLLTIPHLREMFDCQVGLSDHTLGIGVAVASVALGTTVIEKHFTLSRADGGVDSVFSLEPAEMKSLVNETKKAWESLGVVNYEVRGDEKKSLAYRRSLYVVKDMKAGDVFTKENLRAIRPGHGLEPRHYNDFLGRKSAGNVAKGTPVCWDLMSKTMK